MIEIHDSVNYAIPSLGFVHFLSVTIDEQVV